jgi:hypothetical protein
MRAIRLLAKIGITIPAALLLAQSHAPTNKPAFTISLLPETQKVELRTKVKVKAYIESTTDILHLADREVLIGCSFYLVHIKAQSGKEPEKTEYYRHLLGEFLPGDGPVLSGSCAGQSLRGGETVIQTYDLSAYYKLATPGKYDVSIDIDDVVLDPTQGRGIARSYPIHSNTAHFELVDRK